MPDPAAHLQRQRSFPDMIENRPEIIVDPAHDEAVEQRHRTVSTSAGQYAAARNERHRTDGIGKVPLRRRRSVARLDRRCRPRDTRSGIRPGPVAHTAVAVPQLILLRPDFRRDLRPKRHFRRQKTELGHEVT